jgi:hypothetical protein
MLNPVYVGATESERHDTAECQACARSCRASAENCRAMAAA